MKTFQKLSVAMLGGVLSLSVRVDAQPIGGTAPLQVQREEHKIAVSVVGDMARPGTYQVQVEAGCSLFDLLMQAGGATKSPEQVQVLVVRGKTTLSPDFKTLDDLMHGVKSDFSLEKGDVVIVSTNAKQLASAVRNTLLGLYADEEAPAENQFRVSGNVRKGGFFPWPTQGTLTLREAINQAGGLTFMSRDLKTVNGKITFKLMNAHISVKRWINGQKTSVLEWNDVNTNDVDARWNTALQKGDAVEVTTDMVLSAPPVPSSPRQVSPKAYLWLLGSN